MRSTWITPAFPTGRVFLNAPEADETTPTESASGYAGSYYVFGHWGCLGDEGHCRIPQGPLHAHDRRPPHKLLPYKMVVEASDAVKRLVQDQSIDEATVTVVPIPVPLLEDDDTSDVLHFSRLSLITYEQEEEV